MKSGKIQQPRKTAKLLQRKMPDWLRNSGLMARTMSQKRLPDRYRPYNWHWELPNIHRYHHWPEEFRTGDPERWRRTSDIRHSYTEHNLRMPRRRSSTKHSHTCRFHCRWAKGNRSIVSYCYRSIGFAHRNNHILQYHRVHHCRRLRRTSWSSLEPSNRVTHAMAPTRARRRRPPAESSGGESAGGSFGSSCKMRTGGTPWVHRLRRRRIQENPAAAPAAMTATAAGPVCPGMD